MIRLLIIISACLCCVEARPAEDTTVPAQPVEDSTVLTDESYDDIDVEGDDDDDTGEEGDYFEGDIVLGDDENDLEMKDYTESSETFRNLVLKKAQIWPEKVLYYNFSTVFTSDQKKIVHLAMKDMQNVSCISFKPRVDETPYIYFIKKKSCSAPIGWNPKRSRIDVSLGGRNCLQRRGTVQHELLHVLGFWHEHSRTDRDSNIIIRWENIKEGREKNFRVRQANESTTLGIPYDFASVMHYRNNSFSRDKLHKATIMPRNPLLRVQMGQRIRMSTSDIAKLNRLYRCDKDIYNVGNKIPGAVNWDTYRETVLSEKPVYFNKLPSPEPLEFEENQVLLAIQGKGEEKTKSEDLTTTEQYKPT